MIPIEKQYSLANTTSMQCPCYSGKTYIDCCRSIHRNHINGDTPLKLMRARYSAYALVKSDFLLLTWAVENRPKNLDINPATKWHSLEVLDSGVDPASIKDGFVTFKALFTEHNKLFTLMETSRFIKRSNRWYYLDGKVELTTAKLAGNSPCPCGSGKKYKRCCKK